MATRWSRRAQRDALKLALKIETGMLLVVASAKNESGGETGNRIGVGKRRRAECKVNHAPK